MALFGPHVNRDWCRRGAPLDAHVGEALRAAREEGFRAGAAAVFVSNPRRCELTLTPAEAEGLRRHAAAGTALVAHSTYAAAPWGADAGARRAFIRREQQACADAGIGALVVHLPSAPPAAVCAGAADLLNAATPGVRLFLETPAVAPASSCYESPEKLAALFDALRRVDPELGRFGLCLDTAHLWTNGVDLSGRAEAEAFLAGLERAGPRLPPLMLHVNDSLRERGRGPDAHAPLLSGKMWARWAGAPEHSGLAAFVAFAERRELVAILERGDHAGLSADYRALGLLGAGRPAAAGAGGGGGAGAAGGGAGGAGAL